MNVAVRSLEVDQRTAMMPRPAERDDAAAGLRVALIVNSVEMGGVEEHVRQLATGLVARGAEVLVVCPITQRIDSFARDCVAGGAEVARVTLSRGEGWVTAFRRAASMVRLLRARRIDVVHMHVVGWRGGRWAVFVARAAGVRTLVCTLHLGLNERASWRARFERRLWNRTVDRFIAVSQATRRTHISQLGQSAAKTVAIANGVDLARYGVRSLEGRQQVRSRWGIPEDAVVVGAVGRLTPQKSFDSLVRALPLIRSSFPEVRVLIVGDGEERSRLEELATALGVGEAIVFAGQRDDVPDHLAAMDVFALPSSFEGLPIAVLEAMATGLPVVATSVDGVPEVVQEGVTGLLVPPNDPLALANALVAILRDPIRAASFSNAARDRASLFTVDLLVGRVLDLYRSAKDPGSGRPA